eukprot:XP_020404614.1 vegetative cell wall protein gp1-like [Zea mays]
MASNLMTWLPGRGCCKYHYLVHYKNSTDPRRPGAQPRTRGLILLRSLKPPLPLPDPSAAAPARPPPCRSAALPEAAVEAAPEPPRPRPPSRPPLPDARAPSRRRGRPRPARGRRRGRPRPALRRRPCPTPARLATPPPQPALRRRPYPTPRAPSRAAAPARAAPPPLPHAATAPGRARDAAPTHAPASSVPTPPRPTRAAPPPSPRRPPSALNKSPSSTSVAVPSPPSSAVRQCLDAPINHRNRGLAIRSAFKFESSRAAASDISSTFYFAVDNQAQSQPRLRSSDGVTPPGDLDAGVLGWSFPPASPSATQPAPAPPVPALPREAAAAFLTGMLTGCTRGLSVLAVPPATTDTGYETLKNHPRRTSQRLTCSADGEMYVSRSI